MRIVNYGQGKDSFFIKLSDGRQLGRIKDVDFHCFYSNQSHQIMTKGPSKHVVVIWSDNKVNSLPENKLNFPDGLHVNSSCRMQHGSEMWLGTVDSFHGKKRVFLTYNKVKTYGSPREKIFPQLLMFCMKIPMGL